MSVLVMDGKPKEVVKEELPVVKVNKNIKTFWLTATIGTEEVFYILKSNTLGVVTELVFRAESKVSLERKVIKSLKGETVAGMHRTHCLNLLESIYMTKFKILEV